MMHGSQIEYAVMTVNATGIVPVVVAAAEHAYGEEARLRARHGDDWTAHAAPSLLRLWRVLEEGAR